MSIIPINPAPVPLLRKKLDALFAGFWRPGIEGETAKAWNRPLTSAQIEALSALDLEYSAQAREILDRPDFVLYPGAVGALDSGLGAVRLVSTVDYRRESNKEVFYPQVPPPEPRKAVRALGVLVYHFSTLEIGAGVPPGVE